jgi:protoheme IX farnesyltransferase
MAGYYAKASTVPLRIEPITPAEDPRWPMAFDISFAVRRGDVVLRDRAERYVGAREIRGQRDTGQLRRAIGSHMNQSEARILVTSSAAAAGVVAAAGGVAGAAAGAAAIIGATGASWRDYLELTKPRVVALIVLTAVIGTLLATPGLPPLDALVFGNLGIALAAASAAAINHLVDRRIDARMGRTRKRPLPSGHLAPAQALAFALLLGVASMVILVAFVNVLTAVLTFASLIVYALVYTVWLKRATPQNIVIGGAAGATPPVLGWVAVTNHIDPQPLLLFLIIFAWTPPHFWALAIARRHDYAKADIPMLPVTHGVEFTRLHVLFYTVLLCVVTMLPYMTGMSGLIYLLAAALLNARFLALAIALKITRRDELPMRMFRFSISYLMWLFLALLLDHYLPTPR